MSYIKTETVQKVEEASELLGVIRSYVDLQKSGSSYKGLSPFVKEKTASFTVNPAKGIWKDFSSGKGGNSAIKFIMEIEKISFPEAVEFLAKKYAIELEYDDSDSNQDYQKNEEKRRELQQLLESVIRKYEEAFQKLPEDHPAKIEIFERRGYSNEIVKKYRIGYALGNKSIYNLCVQNGKKQDAIELGLISENNDKWINRVTYPLMDRKVGRTVSIGLAGRRLGEDKKYPKWMNSVESELYKKDSFWYGLDKSRDSIIKQKEVWIVEGYNDFIAWHENGISNTVSSCGTAISQKQIQILRKLCDKVILCFDPDDAGKTAMLKHISEFISHGFRVQTVSLFPKLDPDDFVRFWAPSVSKYSLKDLGTEPDFRDDGFKFLMQESFMGKDEIEIAKQTNNLARIISIVDDDIMRGIYIEWLSKESKVKISQIKEFVKNAAKVEEPTISSKEDEYYLLPPVVKTPLDQLRPTIKKYQMFVAQNQIWVMQPAKKPPYQFKSVSNFSMEILTHIQDEKFPMKLIRMQNVPGLERVFDVISSEINSPMSFENAVTAHGNFRWKGNRREFEILKTFLFDQMGTGRKIDVLGWQPVEKFWAWNNKIIDPEGLTLFPDKNGVFNHKNTSYYLPSANSIYISNAYKYEAQKKVLSLEAKVSFQEYTQQLFVVHRNHGMMGLLFTIASIFQDVVVAEEKFFPLFFLFGPASSGKDQLVYACQSFFGETQSAINLEGQVSTIKAQVREFAQFGNLISHLSEYKTGDQKLDGMLKGLWDRVGYKRGNLDSHVGVDGVPILSSVMMTGNYAPDQEALITRAIWNFMDQTVFSQAETEEFEKLRDLIKKGISSFTDEILLYRKEVEEQFKPRFREFKATLGYRKPEANSRMIANLSVLGSFYQIFANHFQFPFSHDDMMSHFEDTIERQMVKLTSASSINRWWDCFIASMRGTFADQISIGRDFKLSGNMLYFNFTNCFNRIERQWYSQYKENAPAKGTMIEILKKDESFLGIKGAIRMAKGKGSKSTSVYIVDINKIPIKDEMKFDVDFQLSERGIMPDSDSFSK